nr:HNH/ENDO VII family nuclease [Pseudomonas putida]
MSKVLNEWAPTLDRLGLVGGAAAGKQAGARPVGVPERAELAQVQRAVDYLAGAKATASLEKEVGTYFGQQRKYWSQEPIQYNGNKVYQRNDLIDPGRVDSQTGLTNKQLMENGLAPYGADGKKINLHHVADSGWSYCGSDSEFSSEEYSGYSYKLWLRYSIWN